MCGMLRFVMSEIPDSMRTPDRPQSPDSERVRGAERASLTIHHIASDVEYALAWEGATWFVKFREETGRVRDLVGVQYVAILLANPESRYSPIALAKASGRFKEPEPLHHIDFDADGIVKESGLSRQLKTDQTTIVEIRRRLKELEEVRSGTPFDDLARKDELEALDKYLRQVTDGTGKGRSFRGHSRGLPGTSAVGNAIADGFREFVRCGLTGLTRHLRNCIRPYTDPVAYLPDDNGISWLVTGR